MDSVYENPLALSAGDLETYLKPTTGLSRLETGRLVSKALSGSWQGGSPTVALQSAEIMEILPLLIWTGAGGLVWRHWYQTGLLDNLTAKKLQKVYLLHSTRAAISEQDIKRAITVLREHNIEPILGKGWSVARLYPEAGLRPYGDIDLCVSPAQLEQARAVLDAQPAFFCPIDLHNGFSDLSDRSFETLYSHSQLVKLDNVEVRVLGAEDQLRLLCLHLLRHGGWRPIWFCDIGVMLEQLPAAFDWKYFQSGNRNNSQWVSATLKLANQLLAAKDTTQFQERPLTELPNWLVNAVYRQWGAAYQHRDPPMQEVIKDVRGLFCALRRRWPNAIEATINWHGSVNGLPPLLFQSLEAATRAGQFVIKVIKRGWPARQQSA